MNPQKQRVIEEYWLKRLKGHLPAVPLTPFETPDPPGGAAEGGPRVKENPRLEIEPPVAGALEAMAGESHLGIFILVLSALLTLLRKYTGSEEIIAATAFPARQPDGGPAAGPLMLSRHAVPGDIPFKAFINRVKQQLTADIKHRYENFDALYAKVCARGEGETPGGQGGPDLLRVGFFYDRVHGEYGAEPGPDNDRFQLRFRLVRDGERLFWEARFDPALYSKEMVSYFSRNLLFLLSGMTGKHARRPGVLDTPVADLDVVVPQERRRLLEEWNHAPREYPSDVLLHRLVEEQVAKSPGSAALCGPAAVAGAGGDGGDGCLTYRGLDREADLLAARLRAKGVTVGVIAAIIVERSLEMAVAILGILKTGAAYLPIDPHYPGERKQYMLADSGARVLVTTPGLEDPGGEYSLPVVPVAAGAGEDREGEAPREQGGGISPHDPAYVIYTSGTTGMPKGVVVEHRQVVNTLRYRREAYGMGAADRALQLFPYHFDGFITSFFTPLVSGAAVVMPAEEVIKDVPALTALIAARRITHFISVPQLYRAILEHASPGMLAPLKQVTLAGDKVSPALLELTRQKHPGLEIVNEYGVTEGAVMSTIFRHQQRQRRIAIGRPIANTSAFVLDDRGRVQPTGVAGELYIAGAGVAAGYLNKPELTGANFVCLEGRGERGEGRKKQDGGAPPHLGAEAPLPNTQPPIPNQPGAEGPSTLPSPLSPLPSRLYRTGDLARWLPDGNLELIGRVDHQLKIRGFRIEPGEIEAQLRGHPAVGEVVVTACENKNREDAAGKELTAYYVPVPGYRPPRLWPSVAEFFIYDDLLYHAMTNDERRNESYKRAIRRHVKDKIVLEVGTGKDAILARFCVEAGARKIYAVELLRETYDKAAGTIRRLGLEEKIILVHGDATRVELPEKADVCLSELVGSIGGSEGAAVILNNVRRLLKDDAVMIPSRSITRIAAVRLPEELHREPMFSAVSGGYVEKVFQHLDRKCDLRLCVEKFPASHVISGSGDFEALDFTGHAAEETVHQFSLTINSDSRLDGFLVWLTLETMEGELIDTLEHEHCWLPVFVPAFYPGAGVSRGDTLSVRCTRSLCGNGINPDFELTGVLSGENREETSFSFSMPHFETRYRETPFYQKLFRGDNIPMDREPGGRGPGNPGAAQLKTFLEKRLPAFMIPSFFIPLDALPVTATGKIDIPALPDPFNRFRRESQYRAPSGPLEEKLAALWSKLLGVEPIGVEDNFFQLGGNSLLAAQMVTRLQRQNISIQLNDIFACQTIRRLAENISAAAGPGSACSPEEAEKIIEDTLGGRARLVRYHVGDDKKKTVYTVLYVEEAVLRSSTAAPPASSCVSAADRLGKIIPPEFHPHYLRPAGGGPADHRRDIHMTREEFSQCLHLEPMEGEDFVRETLEGLETVFRGHRRRVTAGAVTMEYPMSGIQRYQLEEVGDANHTTGARLALDRWVHEDDIRKALLELVRNQAVLRAGLIEDEKKDAYYWREYQIPDRLEVPVVDLSGCEPGRVSTLVHRIASHELRRNPMEYPALLTRFLVFKLNLRDWIIFVLTDHLMFDAVSHEIIQRQLTAHFDAGVDGEAAKTSRPEEIRPFAGYIRQICAGPQGMSEEELTERLDLLHYRDSRLGVARALQDYPTGTLYRLLYKVDLEDAAYSGSAWQLAFLLYTLLLNRYVHQPRLPVEMLYNGRHYGPHTYFHTVGEFLDIIPLAVPVDEKNPWHMVEYVQRRVDLAAEHVIHFKHMCHDPEMRAAWPRVAEMAASGGPGDPGPLILFNFEGMFSEEDVFQYYTRRQTGSNPRLEWRGVRENDEKGKHLFTCQAIQHPGAVFMEFYSSFEPDLDRLERSLDEIRDRVLTEIKKKLN